MKAIENGHKFKAPSGPPQLTQFVSNPNSLPLQEVSTVSKWGKTSWKVKEDEGSDVMRLKSEDNRANECGTKTKLQIQPE